MKQKGVRIGEFAKEAGVSARTVRYYEHLGLLSENSRSEGGQRLYTDSDLTRLKRILLLKSYGLELKDIQTVLRFRDDDETSDKRRLRITQEYRNIISRKTAEAGVLQNLITDLLWGIRELEAAGRHFSDCPGRACKTCAFRTDCIHAKKD